jgi:hypothetical protein
MSASRMPAFNPMAAKPSARLHEVVDLPTPPFAGGDRDDVLDAGDA